MRILIFAASVIPALVAAWTTRLTLPYAWTLVGVQASVAVVALAWASRLLQRGWWRITVIPPLAAALVGLAAGGVLPIRGLTSRPAIDLAMQAVVFLLAAALTLRIFFGAVLHRLVTLMPAGHRLRGVLLFPKERAPVLPGTPAPVSQIE